MNIGKALGGAVRAIVTVKDAPVTDSERALIRALFGGSERGRPSVTMSTALKVGAVIACVRLVAEQVACAPFGIYQITDNGRKRLRDHPLARILSVQPNPYITAFDFWRMFVVNLMLGGDAYAEIVRDPISARPLELWPVGSNLVSKFQNDKTGEPSYKIAGRDDVLGPGDMLHVPGLALEMLKAYEPTVLAREIIGLSMTAEAFAAEYFANGAQPSGIITMPEKLKDERVNGLRDEIKEKYSGMGNRHRVMVLENGMSFTKVQVPPNEGQMTESRRFQVEEVCRFFGVPPFKIQMFDKATYSNYEESSTAFVQDCLVPYFLSISQAVAQKLLYISEVDSGIYAEYNLNGLMRGRNKERWDAYMVALGTGAMTPNAICERENLDSFGPDGDKHFISNNLRDITEPLTGQPSPAGGSGGSGGSSGGNDPEGGSGNQDEGGSGNE